MNQNPLPGDCPKRKSRRHLFRPTPGADDGSLTCTCGERLVFAPDRADPKPGWVLEMENGEPASLDRYIARIMRDQDLTAWRDNPEGLTFWMRRTVADFLNRTTIRILP